MASRPKNARRAAPPSRAEWLTELAAYAESLRLQIEMECEGFPADEAARTARLTRAREDFGFFCETYLPHYYNPNKLTPAPARSRLQVYLFAELPRLATNGVGDHRAIAAPRGETKSTTCTVAFPLWCVVFGLKRYVPVIMDAFGQAAEQLEAIKAELVSNPRLLMDFPDATGQGRVWKEGVAITRSNAKLQAFGAGKRMRGLRHGPHRPDLIVCDDLENDENVRSPEQRDKLERWLKRTVLNLGPPDGSLDLLYIGTVLHYDAVLSRTLKSPLWEGAHFRSIIEWPERMDLWDQWETLLHAEGPGAGLQFYADHRAEMDRGAVVSWPAVRPLYQLMLLRADDRSAFDSEHQNDPVSLEDNPFAGILVFWPERLRAWVFYGAIDPSLGKNNKRRDPSALLVGGFDRASGRLDVVEALIRRRTPDKIISDVITLQREYRCQRWACETVQFQEFLHSELVKRSAAAGVPVPAQGVRPHTDKELRIEAIQPHMANGLIRLSPKLTTLIDQLRHWPDAEHDDGPDALAMLWELCLSGTHRTFNPMRLVGL